MTMNPEQAWQSVLGQLQSDMPRASFDSWVRDTQFISFENNLVTVSARTQYARDWLENRLSSTVSRLLAGMLNHSVDVEFVVSPDDPGESDEPEEPEKAEPREDEAEIQVVNRLHYDEIVLPSRVVAIPGYFSRLIPEIGARNAWLYVFCETEEVQKKLIQEINRALASESRLQRANTLMTNLEVIKAGKRHADGSIWVSQKHPINQK